MFKNDIDTLKEKYVVGSAINFPTKSILCPMIFTQTSRQLGN